MPGGGRESFRTLLSHAETDLWTEFERARELHQRGDIGSAREGALGSFLRQQLPRRFEVADGEVIDQQGHRTGQVDLFIFDESSTRPLQTYADDTVLLPAEALLAVIEVKSKLTQPEVDKSLRGIEKVHKLRPWQQSWLPPRQGEDAADQRARVFTTVFAYRSSLTADPWAVRELKRVRDRAKECRCAVEMVDRLVVLDRGMLLPASGRVAQPGEEKGVLGLWFFSLINFLAREVQHRKPFPWDGYEPRTGNVWQQVAPAQHDLARPKRRTTKAADIPRVKQPRKLPGQREPRAKKASDSRRRHRRQRPS